MPVIPTSVTCTICGCSNPIKDENCLNCGRSLRQEFSTGAKRSSGNASQRVGEFPPRFDLLPPIALIRVAQTYGHGAEKYPPHNWTKGFPMSVCIDHALAHISMWQRGDMTEDHLAHACFNLFCVLHFSETRPDLDDRHPAMMDMAPKSGVCIAPDPRTVDTENGVESMSELGPKEKAVAALRIAMATFRDYSHIHRQKNTQEGREKADRNSELANLMEKSLVDLANQK